MISCCELGSNWALYWEEAGIFPLLKYWVFEIDDQCYLDTVQTLGYIFNIHNANTKLHWHVITAAFCAGNGDCDFTNIPFQFAFGMAGNSWVAYRHAKLNVADKNYFTCFVRCSFMLFVISSKNYTTSPLPEFKVKVHIKMSSYQNRDSHYTDKVVSRRSYLYNENDRHTHTVSAVSAVVQVLVQAKQRIDSTSLQRLKSFTSYLAIYHGVLLADIVSFTEHHTMYSLYLYISRYRWRNNG